MTERRHDMWSAGHDTSHGTTLVVGSDSFIGRALVEYERSAGHAVLGTTRRLESRQDRRLFLDLDQEVSCWTPPPGVSVAYLCASVSSLRECRARPRESSRINVERTVELAKRLAAAGVFVVWPSTTMVYDGTRAYRRADEMVCPRTPYGQQKAEAERRLSELGDSVAIVRLSKVIGPTMPLLAGWLESLVKNEPIQPFSDMVLSPVPVNVVARVLGEIGRRRLAGIMQFSGAADVTYEELARWTARRLGVPDELVRPIASAQAIVPCADVPCHTTLDTSRVRADLGIEPPSVAAVLDAVLCG